ncbi:hypothetical protein ACN28I_14355 [Archangium gephyra]|uniref:hypothetical protein n=1 Tax=Archangium gephyra TaxID=48 RepID=UPI003B778A3F
MNGLDLAGRDARVLDAPAGDTHRPPSMAVPPRATIAERSWDTLRSGTTDFLSVLDAHLGVRVPGFLPPSECAALARRVYAGRPFWISDFDGVQFSLGRAWYTHLEQDREDEYFANARTSDAVVERMLPGLQGRLCEAISTLVGAPAVKREGWCGPGVHIFPAGEWLSRNGGDVHFDNEGLSGEQCARRSRALTLVLMLQPPESGGALRLWDVTFAGSDDVSEREAPVPARRCGLPGGGAARARQLPAASDPALHRHARPHLGHGTRGAG